MKTIKFLRGVIILIGILLSACAPSVSPSAPENAGGDKSLSDVSFTGVIESMSGDQWVINGQTIQVDTSVLRDGPFAVGDAVKVEAVVADDGSVTAERIETPSASDLAEMSTSTPETPSTQPLVFDDSGTEAFGTVESITDTSITIGGQTFTFAPGVEIEGEIAAGDLVKLHFTVNADGTLSVMEIEIADPTQIGDDNEDNANDDNANDDNGNDDNSNDDDGNDDNSNDDNSNDDDSNDDNGGNSNDDDDDNSDDSNDNG